MWYRVVLRELRAAGVGGMVTWVSLKSFKQTHIIVERTHVTCYKQNRIGWCWVCSFFPFLPFFPLLFLHVQYTLQEMPVWPWDLRKLQVMEERLGPMGVSKVTYGPGIAISAPAQQACSWNPLWPKARRSCSPASPTSPPTHTFFLPYGAGPFALGQNWYGSSWDCNSNQPGYRTLRFMSLFILISLDPYNSQVM